ncbi:MAG TPA: hypothetical protein VJT09_18770 [Pyrinomonadaceae bacterium]|nr:hypothetical protein [Pyrinomonadaceae bacterium]
MREVSRKTGLSVGLLLFIVCALASVVARPASAQGFLSSLAQETLPSPPSDRALVYYGDGRSALAPLAFEAATTPLRIEEVAKGDKRSYVELKGESSATAIALDEPRFYVFLPDDPHAKPPFIVRLTEKRGARRVTAVAQKGYKGFAIDSEEIIKPHYRVLGREGGMIFMEIRAREPLMFGQYAIIGADLQRVATFRIAAPPNS